MVSLDINSNKKIIGIYPWVDVENKSGDKHQTLFANALEEEGYTVMRIKYRRGFPITNALKTNMDVLILDWVHSFYTSQSLLNTLGKSFLGILDLTFIEIRNRTIIWNLHNLQRHDGKYQRIEKFCFQQLAKKVNYIRVFDQSHVQKVSLHLKVSKDKIVTIPQGNYKYDENRDVDLYQIYDIPKNKKILLFFGSIREGKGLEQFLKSFIDAKLNDWVLLIAGKAYDKNLGDKIEKIASRQLNIFFNNNYVPDCEVESYFKGVRAIVLPYTKTLNSGVLLLAKSFGTTTIANSNFKELVGKDDFITNLFDHNNLMETLKTMPHNNPAKKILTENSWEMVIKKFEQLIK